MSGRNAFHDLTKGLHARATRACGRQEGRASGRPCRFMNSAKRAR